MEGVDLTMIEKRVLKVIKDNLQTKVEYDLSPEDNIEELGIDSISYIDLIVGVEKEFGIEIDDEKLFFPKGEKLSYLIRLVTDTVNM
jgi:acyl carrier protein